LQHGHRLWHRELSASQTTMNAHRKVLDTFFDLVFEGQYSTFALQVLGQLIVCIAEQSVKYHKAKSKKKNPHASFKDDSSDDPYERIEIVNESMKGALFERYVSLLSKIPHVTSRSAHRASIRKNSILETALDSSPNRNSSSRKLPQGAQGGPRSSSSGWTSSSRNLDGSVRSMFEKRKSSAGRMFSDKAFFSLTDQEKHRILKNILKSIKTLVLDKDHSGRFGSLQQKGGQKQHLQYLLSKSNVHLHMTTLLNSNKDIGSEQHRELLYMVLRTMTAIMAGCPTAKHYMHDVMRSTDIGRDAISYFQMLRVIKLAEDPPPPAIKRGPKGPSHELLEILVDMMLDGTMVEDRDDGEGGSRKSEMLLKSIISNPNVIHVFMALIPQCGVKERRWILKCFKMLLGDGTYDIKYANGETETNVDHFLVRAVPDEDGFVRVNGAMVTNVSSFVESQDVEARFGGKRKFERGTVTKVNENPHSLFNVVICCNVQPALTDELLRLMDDRVQHLDKGSYMDIADLILYLSKYNISVHQLKRFVRLMQRRSGLSLEVNCHMLSRLKDVIKEQSAYTAKANQPSRFFLFDGIQSGLKVKDGIPKSRWNSSKVRVYVFLFSCRWLVRLDCPPPPPPLSTNFLRAAFASRASRFVPG
jgi:hypothetical protein